MTKTKSVTMTIWKDETNYDLEDFTGELIPTKEIEDKIPEAFLHGVYVFPDLEDTTENREKLEKAIMASKKAQRDLMLELSADDNYIYEAGHAVEMAERDNTSRDAVVYCTEAEAVGNLLDWDTCPVYEYWDGSNNKEIWFSPGFMTETEVTYNPEAKICLDEWDGNNWSFQDKFNHAYIVPLVMVDGQDAKGDYLFVEYTDCQGNIPTARIIGPAEAEELLKQQQEI